MRIAKKIDRAFQWAGERMGGEAKTTHSDDFKMLEMEMSLRNDGMERLQKSMGIYNKWITRRCDNSEDKERSTPAALLGRTMTAHGNDFEPDSEFGNCLVTLGSTNERLAGLQEAYADSVSATWLDHVDRNVAMMKEYTSARKKLESRRLAYDASLAKEQKARRDDYRIEEEVRLNKAKFEESEEDIVRRMQDIKEAEIESVSAITSFLDAQLEYHERAAEELRRARQAWTAPTYTNPSPRASRPLGRSRSNTARSWNERRQSAVYEEPEPQASPMRMPIRSSISSRGQPPPPPQPPRPSVNRATTYEGRILSQSSLRGPPAPLSRIATDSGAYGSRNDDIFADDASTASGSGSPDWTGRSASPATSYGSLSRTSSSMALKKAPPPPPPVNRARKPAPPVPARRESSVY